MDTVAFITLLPISKKLQFELFSKFSQKLSTFRVDDTGEKKFDQATTAFVCYCVRWRATMLNPVATLKNSSEKRKT